MKYIIEQQFLEQSDKVKETLLNWWKCEKGDIFKWIDDEDNEITAANYDNKDEFVINILKKEAIPLFTTGQLIDFIEEWFKEKCKKEKVKVDINYYTSGYTIYVFAMNEIIIENIYLNTELGTDLLQALWKVVVDIIEEE